MLAVDALTKSYGGSVPALAPTSFAVDAGDALVLLGPTGSGKSTLLRLIAGLDAPDAGAITVAGERVERKPPHRRNVGMLPQRPALYPDMTVAENLRVGGGDLSAGVELLRLGPLLERRPDQLSGGELQRVALAKLVGRRAAVWLLDEPFSGLDPALRANFRADLHLLAARAGATIVLVTHDPADAWASGRRVGVMDSGRLLQLGTPAELRDDPGHLTTATVFGQVGCLFGRVGGGEQSGANFVSDCGAATIPVLLDGLATAPHNLALGIRPADVLAAPPGSTPPATPGARLSGWPVISAEPDGSGWRLTVASPRDPRVRLLAGLPSGSPPPVGTPTDWFIPADRVLWFALPSGVRLRRSS